MSDDTAAGAPQAREFTGKDPFTKKPGRFDQQNVTVWLDDGSVHKYWDWTETGTGVSGEGAHDLAILDGVLYVMYWSERVFEDGKPRTRRQTVRVYRHWLHAEGSVLHDPFAVSPEEYDRKRAAESDISETIA